MLVDVHWYERLRCPRCNYQGGRRALVRHVYIEHDESLVGSPVDFATFVAELYMKFGGVVRVIDIEPPLVGSGSPDAPH